MADVGLRDLGTFVPERRSEPQVEPQIEPRVSPVPARAAEPSVLVTPPPAKPALRAVFAGDLPSGADALGVEPTLGRLAELAAHRGTATPLCIGLLGGAGAGKSFALERLAARVAALAAAAGGAQGGPFLSCVHVQRVDAASLEGDVALGLAARLHEGLRKPYPDLAREIGHSARDPHVVLREVNEKLDDARRRLDSERRALDDAGSRRARLVETVLYEAAGSQVDAYARANRAGIESRLEGFGITGDPLRNYKDLVQYVSGAGKAGLALRALWTFKGQTKLIVVAIMLAAIGIGLGIAIDDQATWLGLLAGSKAGASVADWARAHVGLLGTLRGAAFVGAALAILFNLFRATAFLGPIFKGVRLLDGDLDTRRRDLDSLYAHQTKRVDTLDSDVERLTQESTEAERRVGGPGTSAEPSPFEPRGGAAQAQSFFAVLARMMAEAQGQAPQRQAPQRIVLALDHLDALPAARAHALLGTLHRAAGAGITTLVALDPARLGAEAAGDLARWIQVPLRLDAGGDVPDYAGLVQAALGRGTSGAATRLDASRSALDAPVSDEEAGMLAGLAALAGPSPRGVKRLVNLYALARHEGDARPGALALMLALAQGGTADERATVASALAVSDPAVAFDVPAASPRLQRALGAATAAEGPFNRAEAVAAARQAARFAI